MPMFKKPPDLLPKKLPKNDSSFEPDNATLFHEFICKLLHRSKMLERSAKFIAENAWCHHSQQDNGVTAWRWLQYASEKKRDEFDVGIENIMNFLEYCFFEKEVTYVMLQKLKSFVSVIQKLRGTIWMF